MYFYVKFYIYFGQVSFLKHQNALIKHIDIYSIVVDLFSHELRLPFLLSTTSSKTYLLKTAFKIFAWASFDFRTCFDNLRWRYGWSQPLLEIMTQQSAHLAALQKKRIWLAILERLVYCLNAVWDWIQSRKQKGMKNVHKLEQPKYAWRKR